MNKKKKTRKGVELKSTFGSPRKDKIIWWLAVLQSKKIQLFSYVFPSEHLDSIVTFEEPNYQDAISRRVRDSCGRSFDSYSRTQGGHGTGHSRHSLSSRISPKERFSEMMLQKASHYIETNRRKNTFTHLGIFAEPHLLGMFRSKLSKLTDKKVKIQVPANYSWLTLNQLEQKLLSYLPEKAPSPPRFYPKAQGAWQVPKIITQERNES